MVIAIIGGGIAGLSLANGTCFSSAPLEMDEVAFACINTWRGITRRKPFLAGKTYTRTGSILVGKMVVYLVIDNVDGKGN
jgi:hypothetical protein